MVRVRHRGPGARAAGKLSRDPAVQAAAVALLLGVDPLTFLAQHPDDLAITAAVVQKAEDLRAERERALVEALSTRTAGLTAQAITRWIARNFKRR